MPSERITRRYVYHSKQEAPEHRGKKAAYLVEQLTGSNLVARIVPLGLVKDITAESEIALLAMQKGVTVVGKWSATKRGAHSQARAVLGTDFVGSEFEVE